MTNNGGTAFPSNWIDRDSTGTQVVREQYPGMSLRDYFAIHGPEPRKEDIEFVMNREKAANPHGDNYKPRRRGWNEIRIALRWEFADAMLAQRSKAEGA